MLGLCGMKCFLSCNSELCPRPRGGQSHTGLGIVWSDSQLDSFFERVWMGAQTYDLGKWCMWNCSTTLYKMSHIQGANYHAQSTFRNIVSSNSRIGRRQYCYSDLQMKHTHRHTQGLRISKMLNKWQSCVSNHPSQLTPRGSTMAQCSEVWVKPGIRIMSSNLANATC